MRNKLLGQNYRSRFLDREYSSVLSVDDNYIYTVSNLKPTQFGVILGIGQEIAAINSALSGFNYDSVSDVKSTIEGFGYSLVMTPQFGAMAEQMSGTTNITSLGQFNTDFFDNRTIELGDGFSNGNLNGYPYLAYAGFEGNTFYGTAFNIYTDYTQETPLSSLFSPNQDRNLYNYVLNANGSTVENDSSGTSTIFSDGHNPNSNGYNSTTRFSSDDGSHGFAIGTTRLDGNGGPYLRDNPSNAYGMENPNGGDTSSSNFYWGQEISSTTFSMYVFTKFID